MVSFHFTVTDPVGLHARPAGQLVKKAQSYPDKITIAKGEKSADAKRLFAVMGLQVIKGDEVIFSVEGDTEEQTAKELKAYCMESL